MRQKKQPEYRTVATLAELATWFGVTPRSVQNWKALAGFPVETNGEYSPIKVAEWRQLRSIEAGADVGIPAAESPALERWREERFLLAQLDRKERENELIPRAEIHVVILRIAELFRSWTDTCQRQFGADFYQAAIDVLDDIERTIDVEFGQDTS